jgi:hypothetical protein
VIKSILIAPVFIIPWILFMALKLPTALLGVVMIPLIYPLRARDFDDLPWWTTPWANPEDWTGGPKGIAPHSLPSWWIEREGTGFRSFFLYHCIRNPANGLRSIEALDLDIDQHKVQYRTNILVDDLPLQWYEPWHIRKAQPELKTIWYFAWQGFKAGFKIVHLWNDERHLVIKLGWRVEPKDAHFHVNPEGQRSQGAGFASKVLLYREG